MGRVAPLSGGRRRFESVRRAIFGDVAQSVEQRTHNPCVAGSIPAITTSFALIAQLVEHLIRNEGVGGSNPSGGTTHQVFAPVAQRTDRDATNVEATGSNPVGGSKCASIAQLAKSAPLIRVRSEVRIFLDAPRKSKLGRSRRPVRRGSSGLARRPQEGLAPIVLRDTIFGWGPATQTVRGKRQPMRTGCGSDE